MENSATPMVGNLIYFFPNEKETIASHNGANVVPAIVVQAWGNLSANIQVFTMNPDAPNVLRYSVPHKSEALQGQSYWDWAPAQ